MAGLFRRSGPKMLEEMTWQEVAEKLTKTKTVLIPVGSLESHGLHLPIACDTMQGVEIAKRVAGQLEKKGIHILPGPSIPFGVNPDMMDFPGTVDFKPTTIIAILKETCASLYKHGFRNFYLVIAHGGNFAVMQVAAQEIAKELEGANVVFLNWLLPMTEKYPEIISSRKNESHCGEGETSRLLVTAPELVEIDRAQECYPDLGVKGKTIPYNKPPYLGGGVDRPKAHFKNMSEICCLGNPHLATKEKGEKLYTLISDWICSVIETDLK